MEFTKQDLVQCENLIKALKKGTFQLEGVEVLALAQAMTWLGKLQAVLAANAEPKPQQSVPKDVTSPVQETPVQSKVSRASRAKKE